MSSFFSLIGVLLPLKPASRVGAAALVGILRFVFLGILLGIFLLMLHVFLYFGNMWRGPLLGLLLGAFFATLVLALSARLGLRNIAHYAVDFVFLGQPAIPTGRGVFYFCRLAGILGSRISGQSVSFERWFRTRKFLLSLLRANAVQRCSWSVPL